jgi:2,3,4,5-tetrahydropyridine-2-carboxylate N-succinyltransferase
MTTSAITALDLKTEIDQAWAARDRISTATQGPTRTAVDETLDRLDRGELRIAERHEGGAWTVNQWVKQAILLSFRLNPNAIVHAAPPGAYWDKVPTKFAGWDAPQFEAAGFRAVPGAIVRRGAFIARNVVLMPSFVNIGAFVDEGTMIDTWATVGSCAQVGKNCHISGGAGLGGVLEPLQANPTIIEDKCFIGARSEVAEGVIVREGSVLSMGVYLTSTTPIVHRHTGEVTYGEVPPYSVVVSGARPAKGPSLPSTYCAVIMKTVDERTRSKTGVNELLRD